MYVGQFKTSQIVDRLEAATKARQVQSPGFGRAPKLMTQSL